MGEEQIVWLVYETLEDEYGDQEDVVRRVFSFQSNALNYMSNQPDTDMWWLEEWVVDED